MTDSFRFNMLPDNIGELVFDIPGAKVNTFSQATLEELEKHIDKLLAGSPLRALKVTSGKEDSFIAGADLHSLAAAFDNPSIARDIIRTGHRVFAKVASLPFPIIAVINGACLGGGFEFALSCTYRVVTDNPKTLLGLPEVNLGIYPGWGGTQRLPRLVGLSQGLGMVLSGKGVSAKEAYKIHAADAIIPTEFRYEKADEFIRQVLTKEGEKKVLERRKKRSFLTLCLDSNPLGRALVFHNARKTVLEKTKGHYPAPIMALDLIKETYTLPLDKGLRQEADYFITNIPEGFSIARELISLFFIQEKAKKDPGAAIAAEPRTVSYAAVVGAGTMGATLGWLFADHNIPTRLKDVSWELVGKGIGTAKALFSKGLKARKLKNCEFERRLQLLTGTVDYSGFRHANLVIEAATENLDLKKKIFAQLEENTRPDAILATNTSSLTVSELSEGMKYPQRVVGMHFFNPVNKMPLVEVVAGPLTSPQTIATAVDISRKLGKTPIVVKDCHGFLVNRILMPGFFEIITLLEEGYPIELLEKQVVDFGMPMGPFELADYVGIDVLDKASKIFEKAYGERMRPPKLISIMAEKGYLGLKNGKGFYLYDKDHKKWNPEIAKLIQKEGKQEETKPIEEILQRFLYRMINEAAFCLDEGIVNRPEYLDLALILGTGFPPFRGGLLRYADTVGIQQIYSTLEKFEKRYGARFKPGKLIVKKAEDDSSFYSISQAEKPVAAVR